MAPELKKQIFIHIALSLLLVAILSVLLFVVQGDINRRVLKIQEFEGRLAAHARAEESLIALKAGAENSETARTVLLTYVPLSDELINFPKELTAIARDHNVQLSVSFGGELSREDGLKELVFEVRTISGYEDFLGFVDALEQGSRLLTLQNVTVSKRSEGGSFEGLISGKVFSRISS